jgi:hypothetical protein
MRGERRGVCVYFVLVERTFGGDVGHFGGVCGGEGCGLLIRRESISNIPVKRIDINNKVKAR